ncbi:MAG: alpha/beta hydrolase [Gemmatimonadaceae bacterium]
MAVAALAAAAAAMSCQGGPADHRAGITGRWEGTASLHGARGPLTVDITPDGDSLRAGVTMNVEALYYNRPLVKVSYDSPRVHFEFPARNEDNGVFDGVLAGDTIAGATRKSGRSVAMRFVRERRTVPPEPYSRETIRFRAADGVMLEGMLLAPAGAGPHPAVVFLHGSGPSDRSDFGHIADRFVRRGIAAFAYDKRGTARSAGDANYASYNTLASDAGSAIAAIAAKTAIIDGRRIGVCGFSEGGWVAPVVAAADSSIAFVIGVVAPGTSYADNGIYQNVKRMEAGGASASDIARYVDLIGRVNAHVRAARANGDSTGDGRFTSALQLALDGTENLAWRPLVDLPRRVPAGRELSRLRWQVLDFDPPSYWSRVRAPVLVVLGDMDRNVNSSESVVTIGEALRRGGNDDGTFIVYPRANHNMMVLPHSVGRFHFPAPPPGYPDTLVSWVASKVGLGARDR